MYYKLKNRNFIKKAPYPLHIGDRDVFTTDETIYNEQGYYALTRTEYPQDEKSYQPYYEFEENKIIQKWEEIEEIENESEL